MTEIASKHLGQQGSYAITTNTFDPTFLVPMPRKLAREEIGVEGKQFVGYDTWHCHEATFLLNNGVPLAGTLKVVYPSDSEFMVESKSFKLYLNTFDMCKMGATVKEAIANYEKQVSIDLSNATNSSVAVKFFREGDQYHYTVNPGENFQDLYKLIGLDKIEAMTITDYNEEKKHFEIYDGTAGGELYAFTNVLRSRCRHTKQKDTGTAFFYIKTKKGHVRLRSLLEEVVSLREVNEFHEFCAEKLFKTISNHPDVSDCMVMLLYARRGSLDINPVRATSYSIIPDALINPSVLTKKTLGQ